MIVKGYSIDCQNKERLLHEFVSEYGINLSSKEETDVFSAAIKPRNCNNKSNTKKK